MDIITLTKDNLAKEHICCAISSNKDCQVVSKKQWLSKRFDDGLVFKKCNVRGKCFIEYIPAEKAWSPIEADGYMYINCLWVSGQFKGHVKIPKINEQGFVLYYTNQCPFTSYSLFYNGKFLTNEILSEKGFEKILTEKGL